MKKRCINIVFDNSRKKYRKCKRNIYLNKMCKQHYHIQLYQMIKLSELNSLCCFCGNECNPCSQSCGKCAREITMKSLGW